MCSENNITSQHHQGCFCTVICFNPSQDAYIAEFYPHTNFGDSPYLYVSQYDCQPQVCPCNDDYRSLLQFDLCSLGCNYIPPNSEICYAYLELSIYRNEVPVPIEVCLYNVVAPWDEGSVTWCSQPPIHYCPEYCSTVCPGDSDKLYFDVCSLVKGWYSGCIANNGIMLIGNELFNSLVGFYSSEFPNSMLHPKLVIGYIQKCCVPFFNGVPSAE